jgi:hypothetical protein
MRDLAARVSANGRRIATSLLTALAIACAAVIAAPLQFGARTLEFPDPAGFVPVSARAPQFFELAAAYLPATNRMVEIYVPPDDAAKLEAGEASAFTRYFQIQSLRSVDGTPVSAAEFAGAANTIEAEIQKGVAQAEAQMPGMAQRGNAALREVTGRDDGVNLGQLQYLGSFRREPWALFYATSAGGSATMAGEREAFQMVSSAAVALIDHQLVYLYAFAEDTADGRAWSQQAINAWADAVHAANPDDPALEASAQPLTGSPGSGIVRGAIIGGLIGGLVGLIAFLARKRRNPT